MTTLPNELVSRLVEEAGFDIQEPGRTYTNIGTLIDISQLQQLIALAMDEGARQIKIVPLHTIPTNSVIVDKDQLLEVIKSLDKGSLACELMNAKDYPVSWSAEFTQIQSAIKTVEGILEISRNKSLILLESKL